MLTVIGVGAAVGGRVGGELPVLDSLGIGPGTIEYESGLARGTQIGHSPKLAATLAATSLKGMPWRCQSRRRGSDRDQEHVGVRPFSRAAPSGLVKVAAEDRAWATIHSLHQAQSARPPRILPWKQARPNPTRTARRIAREIRTTSCRRSGPLPH